MKCLLRSLLITAIILLIADLICVGIYAKLLEKYGPESKDVALSRWKLVTTIFF